MDLDVSLIIWRTRRLGLRRRLRLVLKVGLDVDVVEDHRLSLARRNPHLLQVPGLPLRFPRDPPGPGSGENAGPGHRDRHREGCRVPWRELGPEDLRPDDRPDLAERVGEGDGKGRPGRPGGRLQTPRPHGREPGVRGRGGDDGGGVHAADVRVRV